MGRVGASTRRVALQPATTNNHDVITFSRSSNTEGRLPSSVCLSEMNVCFHCLSVSSNSVNAQLYAFFRILQQVVQERDIFLS